MSTMTGELPRIPDCLASNPATDKLIWNVLRDADGSLTVSELATLSHTPKSTVYESVRRLVRLGVVDELPAPESSCQWRYRA